jgi:hypothetical protein
MLDSNAVTVIRVGVFLQDPSQIGTTTAAEAETKALELLAAAASSASSDLSVVAAPIAVSVQAVEGCDTICASPGTVASRRNANNDGCSCTCHNQWTGDTCATCASPYAGTDCDECETGYSAYPTCFAPSACSQPNGSRPSVTETAACQGRSTSTQQLRNAACAASACSCLGGAYDTTARICTGASSDPCVRLACDGGATRCFLTSTLRSYAGATPSCDAEFHALTSSLDVQSTWCAFDVCVSGEYSHCTTDQRTSACVRTSASDISAAPARAVLVAAAAACLLAFVLV